MDPNNALLLFVVFQASEKVIEKAGEKISDALSKPLFDALEDKAKWLAGVDETSKRWEEYCIAADEAQKTFLRDATNPGVARLFLKALFGSGEYPKHIREQLLKLTENYEQISFLNEENDLDQITRLIYNLLRDGNWEMPNYVDFIETSKEYWHILEDKLFAQPSYRELIRDQTIRKHFRQLTYDGVDIYLEQFIHHYNNLDFIGISDIQERSYIQLGAQFVQPLAEKTDVDDTRNDNSDSGPIENNQHLVFKKASTISTITPVRNALQGNTKVIFLGDPGAGKTVLLRHIALSFAMGLDNELFQNEKRFPIFIRLQDFFSNKVKRSQNYSLIDYLYTQSKEEFYIDLEPGFFEKKLKLGECCICLDGLDEVGGLDQRIQAKNIISTFVNRYQRNRFVISSRLASYQDSPFSSIEFSHYRILPFDENAIRKFIQLWFRARITDPVILNKKIKFLTGAILSDSRLKSLATNPLMLTIIALVNQTDGDLPNQRTELYERCITTQLETWEKSKGYLEEGERIHFRYRRRLLERMAFCLQETSDNGNVTRGDVELILLEYLMKPPFSLDRENANLEVKAFISLVKKQTGMIINRGKDSYAFVHLTFQEYLAACDIHQRGSHNPDAIIKEIFSILDKTNWQIVIVLLLGILSRYSKYPTIVVRKILQKKNRYENLFFHRLFLAARILIEHTEIESRLEFEIIDQLVALSKSNTPAAEDAIEYLGKLQGNERIKDELLEIGRNKSYHPRRRQHIINAIYKMDFKMDAQVLWWEMILDSSLLFYDIRYKSLKSIENIPLDDIHPETVNHLTALFYNDQEPIVLRCRAGIILRKLTPTIPIVKKMVDMIDTTKNYRNLDWICLSLGEIGQVNIAVNKLMDIARKATTHQTLMKIYRDLRRGLLTENECFERCVQVSLDDDFFTSAVSSVINEFPQIATQIDEFASDVEEPISSRYLAVIAIAKSQFDPYIAAQRLVNVVMDDYKLQGRDSVIISDFSNLNLLNQLELIIGSGVFVHPFARIRAISPLVRMENIEPILINILKTRFSSSLISALFWFYLSHYNFAVSDSILPEFIDQLCNSLEQESDFLNRMRIAAILCRYGVEDPFTDILQSYLQKVKTKAEVENDSEFIDINHTTYELNYLIYSLGIDKKLKREQANLLLKIIENPTVDFDLRVTVYRNLQGLLFM